MKRILTILIMFFAGTALFAQSVDVRPGRTYIVQSTDGSGQVPLFTPGAGVPRFLIPDGTEIEPWSEISGNTTRFQVRHPDYQGALYMEVENIKEETAESIAKRAASKKAGRIDSVISVLYWGLIIIGFIFLLKRNKKTALIIYRGYYTQKRREFPWLEEWWKRFKYEDAAEQRAGAAAGAVLVISIIVFFVLAIVFGFIHSKIVPSSARVLNALSSLAVIALVFVISAKVSEFMIKQENPATSDNQGHGLVLECPSCHCPHAWGMVFQQIFITDKITETVKKTTTTWEEDSSGRRVLGSTRTRTKTKTYTTYSGEIIRDFRCENCGHTHHGEYWDTWNDRPETEPQHFDPPKRAW